MEIGVFLGAVLFALMTAYALGRARVKLAERPTAVAVKEALLQTADLRRLHNKVYVEVGEDRWEGEVKPRFLHTITVKTVGETGNPFPAWEDIVEWVRSHPDETRQIMENSARE